jgi:hypothetical protein
MTVVDVALHHCIYTIVLYTDSLIVSACADLLIHLSQTLQVIDQYGADALRLYLIDSPVVRAEPLRFREAGVLSVVKDVLLPWFNTLRFFTQQV